MRRDHNQTVERLQKIIDSGSEIAGSAVGATAGLFIDGPAGAIGGAALGTGFGASLAEVATRMLSKREQVRVGAACRFAALAIQERLEAGDEYRSDDFFISGTSQRSPAEEVAEGVLVAAQRQHEERKVEFYGYLLANLAFQEEVDQQLANWLIRMADAVTWAQLCLLAAIAKKEEVPLPEVETHRSIVLRKLLSSWLAIESLIDEEKEEPHTCTACGEAHHPGITQAFRRFLATYAPESPEREQFYELRSRIAHGSRLLVADDSDEFGAFEPIDQGERSQHVSLNLVVRTALTNWLAASIDRPRGSD